MTSPSETASYHQVVPEDDQNMPELDADPGGVSLAGHPESPAPAESGYPGVTSAGSAAEKPDVADTADAEAPVAFSMAPAAQPEPVPATPNSFPAAPVAEPEPALPEPLSTNGASPGTRWPEIQAMFVDDPRASVQLAASLLDGSVDALVMSLKEQQHSLLRAWQGDDPGTEELRTTVQQYRTFWNRLEDFSRQA
jgi:hypothetical protein